MQKNILTIVGCSGSLALSLMSGYTAQANTVEYVFTAPDANEEVVVNSSEGDFDCGCQASEDREGDLAITLLGCDCAGCRNIVRSMKQPGVLPE